MRIMKNDPDAIPKVKNQILDLIGDHSRMKAANAHYRKHKTMKGFDDIGDGEAKKWDAECKLKPTGMPYPPNIITNSGAKIRKLKSKLMVLEGVG